MWDGVGDRGNPEGGEESKADEDLDQRNARIAASALAALTNQSVDAAAAARLRAYEQAGYDFPVAQLAQAQANRSLLFQSQAVEALRRQEELQMRQQALYNLQQQQVLQRQELQELEYARQLQQQRVAELAARATRQEAMASHEGLSVLEAIGRASTEQQRLAAAGGQDEDGEDSAQKNPALVAIAPRGKPEAMATAMAIAGISQESMEEAVATAMPIEEKGLKPASTKKKPRKRKASTSPNRPKKKLAAGVPTMDDPVPPISDAEYANLDALMEQFCRVPLLSEFSRPVSLLHPELLPKYNKIVTHPIDLGHVCRAIRRRQYKNTRAIQLDMWRIFANCIKYHTSPTNKDNSVPSFVSISLHLRDYFNALWQEYMVPSDPPSALAAPKAPKSKTPFTKRDKDRKNRLATTSATILSVPCLKKTAAAIGSFIARDGRVDKLDDDPIFNNEALDDDGDMDEVIDNLRKLQRRLTVLSESDEDYSAENLDADFRRCYSGDLFESKPSLRIRVGHRIDRLVGKIITNIFEANSRGVNQSSIWGCMAAAIWARENGKKPYWPALVLGIMAPEDQTEDWHAALTERNERRLPDKLRADLTAGKRKAELAIRRQNEGKAEQQSFFLVEFMGTHEFIWVKESDMIETFDPDVDPNQSVAAGNVTKKKRSSRSDVLGSRTFLNALEEGRWALEEFELLLNDTCGDLVEEEGDEEANYSYAVLNQSDDEAEVEDVARHSEMYHEMSLSETEEANELLAGDGMLDFSAEGRKNAKKRTAALKKKKAEDKKAAKKEKGGRSKKGKKGHMSDKDKDGKKEQRELERRRKKRTRERDRVLKEGSRKKRRLEDEKQSRPSSGGKRNPLADKTGRASAMVKAYLMGVAKREDLKPLGLSGVMTMPSAQLDSTGLLGMALAFRAAAGELDMPESGDPVSRGKPWEAVDVDGPASAKEREENLLKKKLLLEGEINRLRAATQKRREMRETALAEKLLMEEEVSANAGAVRLALEKKSRKKPAKKAPKPEVAPVSSMDEGKVEEPVAVASAEVVTAEVVAGDEQVVEATAVAVAETDDAPGDNVVEAQKVEASIIS